MYDRYVSEMRIIIKIEVKPITLIMNNDYDDSYRQLSIYTKYVSIPTTKLIWFAASLLICYSCTYCLLLTYLVVYFSLGIIT